MKNILTVGAALMLTTTAAMAGGLDRSGQGIGAIFESGSYVELSYGSVMPSVSGSAAGGVFNSGNVGVDYGNLGGALKFDVNEKVSVAIIFDQPFGANVDYAAGTGYPLAGSNAEIESKSLTVVGRYKINENVSVHFGPRVVSMEGFAKVVSSAGTYDATFASDTATGYVVGAAYERPDIALRVALTYSSELSFSHDTTLQVAPGVFAPVPSTDYTTPQSLNLDFQSGVAENTLVFGSIRWSEWTTTEINSFGYPGNPLVGYDNDSVAYTLGVGRKFSDTFSGAVSVGFEKANGGIADNLAPTDGNTSLSVGGTYTMASGIELTGGVRYIWVGDATTALGPLSPEFTDNSAVAIGLKVAYNF
ncbi:MAG: long-subunit fatty acid transport protein [Yoonia sp.]|jgi:long-subunit fatty acid transport protein